MLLFGVAPEVPMPRLVLEHGDTVRDGESCMFYSSPYHAAFKGKGNLQKQKGGNPIPLRLFKLLLLNKSCNDFKLCLCYDG